MTNEIEETKRGMYDMLEAMRKAKKHPTMLRAFEEALEEHLEALRKELYFQAGHTSKMREKNDEIQQRLHAIDHAYLGSQTALGVAGDCIRDTQAVNREYQGIIKERDSQIEALKESLEANRNRVQSLGADLKRAQVTASQHLDDCRSAEKLSDDLSEKLTNATTVIGQQEQLIAGQRIAIAELYMGISKPRRRTLAQIAADRAKGHCETCDGLGYVHCNGGRPTAPCPKGCQ